MNRRLSSVPSSSRVDALSNRLSTDADGRSTTQGVCVGSQAVTPRSVQRTDERTESFNEAGQRLRHASSGLCAAWTCGWRRDFRIYGPLTLRTPPITGRLQQVPVKVYGFWVVRHFALWYDAVTKRHFSLARNPHTISAFGLLRTVSLVRRL
jgi:hypothetical protein